MLFRSSNPSPAFRFNVEAAIVFARSVTFHIQKEFSARPDFEEWYSPWQKRLAASPTCAYFLEKRNFVLKQGRLNLCYNITLEERITVHEVTDAAITRPDSPIEQTAAITAPIPHRDVVMDDVLKGFDTGATITGFVDHRPSESAVRVLGEYLDVLAEVVSDAQRTFA